MPLIECPDCGKQLSDQAPSCIHCGRPMIHATTLTSETLTEAVHEGRQSSKFQNDLGTAIGCILFAISLVIGIASGSYALGTILCLASLGLGIWIAYG